MNCVLLAQINVNKYFIRLVLVFCSINCDLSYTRTTFGGIPDVFLKCRNNTTIREGRKMLKTEVVEFFPDHLMVNLGLTRPLSVRSLDD